MNIKELAPVAIIVLFLSSMYYIVKESAHSVVRYDCSISEINPDYPLEVKDACRKLRAENIK